MTEHTKKALKELLARVERWPEDRQHDVMEILLEMERQDRAAVRLNPEQIEEVRRIRRAIRDGHQTFATDEEMAGLWKSFGL